MDSRKGEIELEHSRIVEAIGKRDERGAVKHMQTHLTELQKLMLQYLKEVMGRGNVLRPAKFHVGRRPINVARLYEHEGKDFFTK